MNRIQALFSRKNQRILNVYCTAGFPKRESIMEVMSALQANGADLVEIGIPYSDPLADGPVIQQSNMVALHNGMTIKLLFEQLGGLRSGSHSKHPGKSFDLPLILMGYLNPVMQYGFEKFCKDCKAVGVDGLIFPDLPLYEYKAEYQQYCDENGLDFIFLITPETSEERIREIDKISQGFIYAVSSSSTTGKDSDMAQQESYFKKLHRLKLKNPVLVGFGIKDKTTFDLACKYTNGAIIGSAYIKALQNGEHVATATENFLNNILK